jgi:hypothetical protein
MYEFMLLLPCLSNLAWVTRALCVFPSQGAFEGFQSLFSDASTMPCFCPCGKFFSAQKDATVCPHCGKKVDDLPAGRWLLEQPALARVGEGVPPINAPAEAMVEELPIGPASGVFSLEDVIRLVEATKVTKKKDLELTAPDPLDLLWFLEGISIFFPYINQANSAIRVMLLDKVLTFLTEHIPTKETATFIYNVFADHMATFAALQDRVQISDGLVCSCWRACHQIAFYVIRHHKTLELAKNWQLELPSTLAASVLRGWTQGHGRGTLARLAGKVKSPAPSAPRTPAKPTPKGAGTPTPGADSWRGKEPAKPPA